MSFWDVAGKVAMGAGRLALDVAKNAGEQAKKNIEEMSGKSDGQLFSIAKSSNGLKMGAAVSELKRRNYDIEDIKRRTGR